MLKASTLPKPHKPTLQPKLCQRACFADPKEKQKKSLASQKLNLPTHQARQTKTNGRRTTAYNN